MVLTRAFDELATLDFPMELLRPGVDLQGQGLPPEVVELYSIANGIDARAWRARWPGSRVAVLPMLEFPDAQAAAAGQTKRLTAARQGRRGFWQESWALVFPGPGNGVGVDGVTGHAVFSWPGQKLAYEVGHSLADFLGRAVEWVRAQPARFDQETGCWRGSHGYEICDGPWNYVDVLQDPHPQPGRYSMPAAGLTLTRAVAAVLDEHRRIGSPLPDRLSPPITAAELDHVQAQVGFELHPDVVDLYRIADGVDRSRYPPRSTPALLPTIGFPAAAEQVAVRAERAEQAAGFTPRDLPWWGAHWWPVLGCYEYWIAVDSDTGVVWSTRWHTIDVDGPSGGDAWVRPVAACLADYLAWAVALWHRHPQRATRDGRIEAVYSTVDPFWNHPN